MLTSAFNRIDGWLCSSVVALVQVQGIAVLLTLAAGWSWAAHTRALELRRRTSVALRHAPPFPLRAPPPPPADACCASGPPPAACVSCIPAPTVPTLSLWPGVTVVMPVKGCRAFALENWTSQLELQYPGPLEFLFVTHSADDAAYDAARQLIAELRGRGAALDAAVLVAGPAATCSQKIHNICHGIRAAAAGNKYVLCLDDDVQLHRDTLSTFVARLERDPSFFMATGYPFDVPARGSGFLPYCTLVYHLPLIIAFSLSDVTLNVWGGCMLLPLEHLRNDTYGFMQAWQDGGYSDDLTAAARCTHHSLKIYCPSSAVFVQRLEREMTFQRYWNYLRRQLYVLDTYSDETNRRVNRCLMLFMLWASLSLVWTLLLVGLRGALVLLSLFTLPLRPIYSGGRTTAEAWAPFVAGSQCPGVQLTTLCALCALLLASLSVQRFNRVVCRLLHVLSPDKPAVPEDIISGWRVWLAILLERALVPLCVAITMWHSDIEWSGFRYRKSRGRVVRVDGGTHTKNACSPPD